MMNRTKQYPFKEMKVGQSFEVREQFQHARVAASEYGRKHNQCFTCRMQAEIPGEPRIMRVYRVADSQRPIDTRGRNGQRRIPQNAVQSPSEREWCDWLDTLAPGNAVPIPTSYEPRYSEMVKWTIDYSSATGKLVTAALWHDNSLMIQRFQ